MLFSMSADDGDRQRQRERKQKRQQDIERGCSEIPARSRAGRVSAIRMALFWKPELMLASRILRTSSSYSVLSASASRLSAWYSKERAFKRVELRFRLGDCFAAASPSRLTASRYSTSTRWPMFSSAAASAVAARPVARDALRYSGWFGPK